MFPTLATILEAEMKRNTIFYACAVALAATFASPSGALAASVDPVEDDGTFMESVTCRDLGFSFWNKIEGWGYGDFTPVPPDDPVNFYGYYETPGHLQLDQAYANTITIYLYDPSERVFSWTVDRYPIGLLYVKAGTLANLFWYDPEAFGDTDVYPPETADNVSHASWCWNVTGPNGDECYQDETAWADGPRYNTQGNWATYTPYAAESCVKLYAGQTMDAGTACFENQVNGNVDITIELANGFIFYYDVLDDEDDNIKVQDYATPPDGNPPPGLFDWKVMAPVGSTVHTLTVPLNAYYGIHLDVAYPVECPDSAQEPEPTPDPWTPPRYGKAGNG
jgi:hypothetical protein